jgi:hypothetical protein
LIAVGVSESLQEVREKLSLWGETGNLFPGVR